MGQDAASDQEPATGATASGQGLFGRRIALKSPTEALQPESAPPPPPAGPPPSRRTPTLSAMSGFLSFLLLAAVGAVMAFGWLQQRVGTPGPLQADKVVAIARGTEGAEIINQLETEGVIDNAFLLNVELLVEGNRSRVRAGEFLFKKNASLREVIDTLVNGKEILHSITIPEGLTSEQIVQRLMESDILTGDIREAPKEGTLLPDTYRVARGMPRADLVRKMQDEQKRVLDQIWARRIADLPIRSPYDLLTLASIVEKETGRADERPHVASVFLNRLSKRMKLQSDPTIVYGLVGGRGTLGRGILRSEVDKPTAYNTYVIEGLPPGPIANPGRAALDAVARPSRTKDVYFVADGTGGHAFAETLDQHNKNVLRWRQLEKDAKDRQQQQQQQTAPAVDRVAPDALGAPAPATDPAPTARPAPAATGAPRDRRGEADLPGIGVFGALPASFGAPAPEPDSPTALALAAAVVPAPGAAAIRESARPAEPVAPAPAAKPAFSLGAQLDERLVTEFTTPRAPANALDGVDDGDMNPGMFDATSVPVSPARRAEQKARAARYGVSAGSDDLPADPPADADRAGPAASAGPKIIKVYDASEGTPLDPLKDRSWDLSTAKTVPVFKPDPSPAQKPPPRARK